MKKLTILAMVWNVAVAQSPKDLVYLKKGDVFNVVDSFIATTKNEYKLEKVDSLSTRFGIEFDYKSSDHKLTIFYYKYKQGGNVDLAIPDTIKYRFGGITGFYQDLFPYWKKYFEPDADILSTANDGHGKVLQIPCGNDNFIVTLNKSGSVWQLQSHLR